MGEEYNGVERRLNRAEEFGELKATVAANTKTIEKLAEFFEKHAEEENKNVEELKEEMRNEIGKIHQEFVAYRTAMRVLKGVGAIVILVATLKFGDVVDVWRSM